MVRVCFEGSNLALWKCAYVDTLYSYVENTNHDVSAVGTDEGHECCADGPHDQPYVAEGVRHSQKPWPQATLDHVKERAQVPTNAYYNKHIFIYVITLRKTLNYIPVIFFLLSMESGVQGPKQSANWKFSWPEKINGYGRHSRGHENVYFGVFDISERFSEGVEQPCHTALL